MESLSNRATKTQAMSAEEISRIVGSIRDSHFREKTWIGEKHRREIEGLEE